MRKIRWSLALAVAGVVGCASGTAGGPDGEPEPRRGGEPAAEGAATPGGGEDEATAPAPQGEEAAQEEEAPAAATTYPPMVEAGGRVAEIRVEPSPVEIEEGDTLHLSELDVTPVDDEGNPVQGVRVIHFLQSRTAVVDGPRLIGLTEGEDQMIVAVMAPPEDGVGSPEPKIFRAPVIVRGAPVVQVEVTPPDESLYVGTSLPLRARALTESGDERRSVEVAWRSRDPGVAQVTPGGYVRGIEPGSATLVATAEGVDGTLQVQVRENPVRSVELTPVSPTVATGDVVRFEAVTRDGNGERVGDVPLTYTVSSSQSRTSLGASVYEDGAFVASKPGVYRVVAAAGPVSAEAVVTAEPREVGQEVVQVGQGIVSHHPSSDLWVFEGQDGRDYAYVGTHSGGQKMFAWDVTDPSNPVLTDSVVVDARVVNDVKVNDDASIAVITREGASNRRNGIVLLDIADPAHPAVLGEFTETVTGGVHNTYIVGDLVYAIHDGTLDVHIIDISDPLAPREVGRWGIDRPGKYLHDIWVVDGLAYVSYWDDGVYILDVGDGRWGGTPTDPAVVSSYSYTELAGEWGNTHVAFPYTNSDGNTYLFVGDEVFGCETCVARSGPDLQGPRGYVHIFDISDPENPEEVGRYEVPEAGVHNLWAEDDKLYAAYYQAGLRVVDISGELRGNLYDQGREIAWFPTGTEDGFTPNQAMAWGPQPYGENLFISDLNSGLWVVRLEPREEETVIP